METDYLPFRQLTQEQEEEEGAQKEEERCYLKLWSAPIPNTSTRIV